MTTGSFRRRLPVRISLAALLLAVSAPALAGEARQVSIPPTTLDSALETLARQAHIDWASSETGLRTIRTPAVHGRMSARQALDRVLRGTPYRAIEVDPRSFRIVRALERPAPRISPKPLTLPAAPEAAEQEGVVTGSKQRVTMLRYPGSLARIGAEAPSAAERAPDMTDIARTMPMLQSTELGPGRNKIFIRGVADSSFVGAVQSTASTYFDDVQLAYSGADPGLKLYDIAMIEVMEGPQGTLYGSGSMGGIIRLTSNPVDLARAGGWVAAGTTVTLGGEPGADLAGVANIPIRAGVAGIRLLAYHVRDGGYIDDRGRGVSNVNRTETSGGRATLRLSPGGGWHVELGALGQTIDARDSQYALRGVGSWSRRSHLAQPFRNSVLLGRLRVSRDWADGLQLVSATSIVGYGTDDLFDATGRPPQGAPARKLLYRVEGAKRLLTQETRLSRSLPDGGTWVAGFNLLEDRSRLSRTLGAPDNEASIIGVTNLTRSGSAFGEVTVPITSHLSSTIGARITIARTDGEPSVKPRNDRFVAGRSTRRIDPTLAASWLIGPDLALFGRYQSGFRTGGLAVARGIGRVADYAPDSISMEEVGLRRIRRRATGLAFSTSLSLARWTGIQADLVNARGLPYTANIGDARILTVEATGDWVPVHGLQIVATALYTHNVITGPMAQLSPASRRHLPDTPAFAGRLAISHGWTTAGGISLKAEASGSYVGRSVLGTGNLLDLEQGGYAVVTALASAHWRRYEVSLSLDNIANTGANIFAFGNPFGMAARDQATPMRPLNARLGFSVTW